MDNPLPRRAESLPPGPPMPLRYLFVDMNSYFASCEQHLRPELRGQPVAVAPVKTDTTCCIAASYEAKKFGVKTGTSVREAKRMCPGLRVVEARAEHYVRIHHRIIAAVDKCLPVSNVLSIDEMSCRLGAAEQEPEAAMRLAREVKQAIARDVGPQLRCSVGLAPNVLLAKVASDMQKPDGLTVIRSEELPERLYSLRPIDFPGIGPRMSVRLQQRGITEVRQLCALSRDRMAALWGSHVIGERWWRRLRGEDVLDRPTRRCSVGHSHVLAPELRNDTNARAVLSALIHKAAARLRRIGYWTASMSLFVSMQGGPNWQVRRPFPHCRDTQTLLQVFAALWSAKPPGKPVKIGVVLGHLRDNDGATPSLFAAEQRSDALAAAMDRITTRFGSEAVRFASACRHSDPLPARIAFTQVPEVEDDDDDSVVLKEGMMFWQMSTKGSGQTSTSNTRSSPLDRE